MPAAPTFSIITVTYNAAALLEGTLNSVAAQSYPHLEYIVVDGASTDGTRDLLQRHSARISRWVSEPDRGLYDAMNKGLQMATGDFVWFLNAGDHLYDERTLERIAEAASPDTDVLFGEVLLVDEQRRPLGTRSERTTRRLPAELTWKSLRQGMVVCHQGILVRRSIAPAFRIDNLAADMDWVIEALKRSRKNTRVEGLLATYLVGGLSARKRLPSLFHRFEVMARHYGWFQTLLLHLWFVVRAGVWAVLSVGSRQ